MTPLFMPIDGGLCIMWGKWGFAEGMGCAFENVGSAKRKKKSRPRRKVRGSKKVTK